MMHAGVRRGVMTKEQRDIDRDAKPARQAGLFVDQLMGVGVADLTEEQAEGDKAGEAFEQAKARVAANGIKRDPDQDEMGKAKKERQFLAHGKFPSALRRAAAPWTRRSIR